MENGARFFQIGSISLVGNPGTGHVVGLSPYEAAVARAFAAGVATLEDVAHVSEALAEQLQRGGYGEVPSLAVRIHYQHLTQHRKHQYEG